MTTNIVVAAALTNSSIVVMVVPTRQITATLLYRNRPLVKLNMMRSVA